MTSMLKKIPSMYNRTKMRHKINEIDPKSDSEVDALLYQHFQSRRKKGFIEVGDVKCVLPIKYVEYADLIDSFEVLDDDIWVVSFPKCGTTWANEMVWCIVNNLDFNGAKQVIHERFPFFEFSVLHELDSSENIHNVPPHIGNSFRFAEQQNRPRLIKTHLPWELLPKQIRDGSRKPRIIYVGRNAKEACISNYNHARLLNGFRGSFDLYAKLFRMNRILYAPFWRHVLSFWAIREDENVLFIKYDDMNKALPTIIHRVMRFLDCKLTELDVSILQKHLNFEAMKNNNAVNYQGSSKQSANTQVNNSEHGGAVNQLKMSPMMEKIYDLWSSEQIGGCGLQL